MGTAWAQTGEATGPPPLLNAGFFALVLAVLWFVIVRPEQQRRREQEKLSASLRRNDQVVLSCGLHGRIIGLNDKLVTIEIAPKVQVQFDRSAVQTVENLAAPEAKEREKQ